MEDTMLTTDSENYPDYSNSTRDICNFLAHFSRNTYSVKHSAPEPRPYMSDAIKILERDYKIAKIENSDGLLCPQYPEIIPIIESARHVTTIYEDEEEVQPVEIDISVTTAAFENAKIARCRQRFPVPVIFFNGKYVCRSSTLASEPEMVYRTGLIKVPGYELLNCFKEFVWPSEGLGATPESGDEEEPTNPGPYDNDYTTQTIRDKVRTSDIKLLRKFNVNTIIDIMVEKRKVKHGLYVSASEKVDHRRYSSFKLLALPYPGCEFFKSYHDSLFRPEGLKYDWDNPANDAVLSVPDDALNRALAIQWHQYKEWDLITITQNYLKYILRRLQEDQTGLVLHCISGWDRTPLFISLVRLSLWADNLIHTSLNDYEILYFTLIYDWYLFGHHLSNRIYKNEEIMAFCFDFLKYIVSDEFGLKTSKKKHSDEMKTDESRSPSRSSGSSVCAEDGSVNKRKRHSEFSTTLSSVESSNDSTITMDIVFEDSNSSERAYAGCPQTAEGDDDNAMDTLGNGDDAGKNKVLSPTSVVQKRTSPIPVTGTVTAGSTPSRRQRSESNGSTTSSASFQVISDSGSVERDHSTFRSQRQLRLESVRSHFISCYQKTVKSESFGPPTRWLIDDIVGNLSYWSRLFDIQMFTGEMGTNGNVEKNETEEHGDETNGNEDSFECIQIPEEFP